MKSEILTFGQFKSKFGKLAIVELSHSGVFFGMYDALYEAVVSANNPNITQDEIRAILESYNVEVIYNDNNLVTDVIFV